MIILNATVPGQPIPHSRPRVTRNGVFYPKAVTAYRRTMAQIFALHRNTSEPHPGPVAVTIQVMGCRANADTDNFAKGVLDALVDARVIEGDSVRVVRRLVVDAWPNLEPSLAVVVQEVPA